MKYYAWKKFFCIIIEIYLVSGVPRGASSKLIEFWFQSIINLHLKTKSESVQFITKKFKAISMKSKIKYKSCSTYRFTAMSMHGILSSNCWKLLKHQNHKGKLNFSRYIVFFKTYIWIVNFLLKNLFPLQSCI